MFVIFSLIYNSSVNQSCSYQLHFGFSNIGPPCFCLVVFHWFGVVSGWYPVSMSLNAIMTTIAAWMTAWFAISLMPSEYASSFWLQMLAFVCPILRCLLLTPYDVIGLLGNNKSMVAYTSLLTTWLQVCFWMNILQRNCATYDWFMYTGGMPVGMACPHDHTWSYWSSIIYTYAYAQSYVPMGEHQSYVNSYCDNSCINNSSVIIAVGSHGTLHSCWCLLGIHVSVSTSVCMSDIPISIFTRLWLVLLPGGINYYSS